jgi:integrase/recombinase XerD
LAGVRGHPEDRPRNPDRQQNKRGGIYDLVERCGQRAALTTPSIADKQVSPDIIRHTTATHLLRAGVDINPDPRLAGPRVLKYY